MSEILKVIILGILEGITEWLPISSTGHLILAEALLKLQVNEAFWDLFLVVIQFGAVLAVVVLYFRRLWPFHKKDEKENGFFQYADRNKIRMWIMILISCLPAVVIGLTLDDWINDHFYNYPTVAVMLIVYGIFFLLAEKVNEGKKPHIQSVMQIDGVTALMIGLFQVLAIIPGTSRSGATILGGILLGMTRKAASEYTFFLAVPVMFGASLLKIVKIGLHFTPAELILLLVGMLTAFLVSVVVIRLFIGFVRKHSFRVFGWYRIVLGIVVLVYFGIRGAA